MSSEVLTAALLAVIAICGVVWKLLLDRIKDIQNGCREDVTTLRKEIDTTRAAAEKQVDIARGEATRMVDRVVRSVERIEDRYIADLRDEVKGHVTSASDVRG